MITAALYSDPFTPVEDDDGPIVLEFEWAPTWHDPKNDVGDFYFHLQNGDPDLAECSSGRLVFFEYDGNPAVVGVIERRERETISPDDQAGEYTKVSGSLIAKLLDGIRVYPETPLGSQPWSETRYFNFANPNFDSSGWDPALELAFFVEPVTGATLPIHPRGWPPGSLAKFIFSRDYDGSNHMPLGTSYFRNTLTIPAGDPVLCAFHVAWDNQGESWVDGILLDEYSAMGMEGWAATHLKVLLLDPGVHTLAVSVTNVQNPDLAGGSPADFIYDVWSVDSVTNTLVASLIVSDDSWVCLDYPAEPPGFTAGAIVRIPFGEAADRGTNTPLWTFTDTEDTATTEWSSTPDQSLRNGSSMLDVLRELSEQIIDWKMAPTGYELLMWEKGTQFIDSGFTLDATNLRHLRHTGIS